MHKIRVRKGHLLLYTIIHGTIFRQGNIMRALYEESSINELSEMTELCYLPVSYLCLVTYI